MVIGRVKMSMKSSFQGYPDLLVLQGSANQNFKLIGFQNSLLQDVHFIKVMGKIFPQVIRSSKYMLSFVVVISTFSCETCSRQKKLVSRR